MDDRTRYATHPRLPLRLLTCGLCAVGVSLLGPARRPSEARAADVQAPLSPAPSTPSPGRAQLLGICADEPTYDCYVLTVAHEAVPLPDPTPSTARLPDPTPSTARLPDLTPVTTPPLDPTPAPTPVPVRNLPVLPRPAPAPPTLSPGVLPIGLDTVLRLGESQNAQIALARERVVEACAQKDVAGSKWLPDIYVGTAFYRHEGGIQNEDGTLTHSSSGALFAGGEIDSKLDLRDLAFQRVNAQRNVWQQKGELSRVTSETLLDASNTYIDWLTARTGEAVALDIQHKLQQLLERAKRLAAVEPAVSVEVARIQSELSGQQQVVLKLRQQAAAAASKLLYVLGLDPASELVPVDSRLMPFDLIDATPATPNLVAQALSTGPGIQEMEGLLNLIQESLERAQGPGRLMPIIEMRMAEGAFGAGPGDSLAWDNRWDLGLQMRWNLTGLLTARDRKRVAQSKIQQAHLAYQDLRGKLTAGVQEAREAILSGRDQIHQTEEQIRQARTAYDLSNLRLEKNPQPSSYSETLMAIGTVGKAQLNYLMATSAYDKAQLRLMMLLGPGAIQSKK